MKRRKLVATVALILGILCTIGVILTDRYVFDMPEKVAVSINSVGVALLILSVAVNGEFMLRMRGRSNEGGERADNGGEKEDGGEK